MYQWAPTPMWQAFTYAMNSRSFLPGNTANIAGTETKQQLHAGLGSGTEQSKAEEGTAQKSDEETGKGPSTSEETNSNLAAEANPDGTDNELSKLDA